MTLFETVMEHFKKLETELRANEMTFTAFKQVQPQFAELLDASLVGARQSPALLDSMNSKYSAVLETFRKQAAEAQTAEEVLKMFEKTTRWN